MQPLGLLTDVPIFDQTKIAQPCGDMSQQAPETNAAGSPGGAANAPAAQGDAGGQPQSPQDSAGAPQQDAGRTPAPLLGLADSTLIDFGKDFVLSGLSEEETFEVNSESDLYYAV